MSEKEKTYTMKSAQSELARLEKSRDKKKEKLQQLTAELKETNAKIKELEGIYDTLYHEDLQRKIASVWFKEQKMTGEQIAKFLELSTQIHDKIDILDVATVVRAVTHVYDAQKRESESSQAEQTASDGQAEAAEIDTYSTSSVQLSDGSSFGTVRQGD